ncbi:MAG: hypothetical protein WCA04_11665 [Geobacteraceae bacterium]
MQNCISSTTRRRLSDSVYLDGKKLNGFIVKILLKNEIFSSLPFMDIPACMLFIGVFLWAMVEENIFYESRSAARVRYAVFFVTKPKTVFSQRAQRKAKI